jgi:glycosyltransferase involved in cell wall biosynthesis
VLEIRDLWPDTLIEMGLRNPGIIKPLTWLERFLYRQADLIITLTEGIKYGVEGKGISADKVIMIPNASLRPASLDQQDRERVRRRLGWHDEVVAVYAGAHGPANALDEIVQAMKNIPETARIRMVFIGDGTSKEELVRKAEGMPHVSFLNSVPKTEIASILRAADIGVLSLRRNKVFEGARPNKLFDYMSNALPVVTTVGGEAERVLMEAGAGMYSSSEDLATTLLSLAGDLERRRQMGTSGMNYVSGTLTREDTASLLAAQLNRLVCERQSGHEGAR